MASPRASPAELTDIVHSHNLRHRLFHQLQISISSNDFERPWQILSHEPFLLIMSNLIRTQNFAHTQYNLFRENVLSTDYMRRWYGTDLQ